MAAALPTSDQIAFVKSQIGLISNDLSAGDWFRKGSTHPTNPLMSKHAHWLWLTDRADSPWYPSVRLFRPRGNDEWSYVFDSAAAELMQLAERKRKDSTMLKT
jgi:hypothetical protein